MSLDELASGAEPWIVTAQQAVQTDEVQEIIQRLAKYNLGVCMPHSHEHVVGEGKRAMVPLDHDMVQVERGLKVSFVPSSDVDPAVALPVAWRWSEGGSAVVTAASCHYCD